MVSVLPPPPNPTRPTASTGAYDALVLAIARGDDLDAVLCDLVCAGAGKTLSDLADAVRQRVVEQGAH